MTSTFQQLTEFITNIDRQLFLTLNGINSPFFDVVMYWLSQKLVWAPLYAILLLTIWHIFRKGIWIVLPLIVLLVTLTDQVSVVFFKDVFLRLRPCHDPSLEGMVHLVRNHCGGTYGFISSHACNTFGVAIFSGFLTKERYNFVLPLMLFWAAMVSYSRIYLGVHFPGDVIVGAIVGSLIGWLMVVFFFWILKRTKLKNKEYNR